jgi:predicted small secreted protein
VVLPAVASLETLRRTARASAARRTYMGIANPILLGAEGDDTSASSKLTCSPVPDRREQLAAYTAPSVAPGASLVRGGRIDVGLVRNLAPLPETTDEVCAVSRRLGGDEARDLLIGAGASEAAIKARSASGELADYAVVHFATHGLVSGEIADLAEPALVLTPPAAATAEDDGLLTASEIATLKLDADAVLLSACNTASGDGGNGGEALSGLAKAFFYAGSRSLMVSHWPVESNAAVRLVTDGFARLAATPGMGRSEALRQSMLALIGDRGDLSRAHPQIWAPFVVVGSDDASALALPGGSRGEPSTMPVGATSAPGPAAPVSRPKRTGASTARGSAAPKSPAFDPQSVFREPH